MSYKDPEKERAYQRAWIKAQRAANPERYRANKRAYYAANREKMRAQDKVYRISNRATRLARKKIWNAANREKVRAYWLKSTYGLSLDQYQKMLEAQGNKCAICHRSFIVCKKTCVDHCPKAGHVRGLLCSLCNQWLGIIQDSPAAAARALKYLSREVLFTQSA
jgi:Recombination endonuclease VII